MKGVSDLAHYHIKHTCPICHKVILGNPYYRHLEACSARQTNKACRVCGKPIMVQPSYLSKRKTCGKECGAILQSIERRGEHSSSWKGGKTKDSHGYVIVRDILNQRPNNSSHQIKEHVQIAEIVLGKPLRKGVVVHHINGIKTDNRKCNLVICENNGYHKLLHKRQHSLAKDRNKEGLREERN